MAHSKVSQRQEGSLGILDCDLNFGMDSYESAFHAMEELVEAQVSGVAFNFSNTEYINSRGIHLIILLVEIASEAGIALYVYGLNAHQKRIFSMVGLPDRLTLVEDEQEIQ